MSTDGKGGSSTVRSSAAGDEGQGVFRSLIDQLKEPVLFFDSSRHLSFANKKARRLFGKEAMGQSLSKFAAAIKIHLPDEHTLPALYNQVQQSGETFHAETTFADKKNKRYRCQCQLEKHHLKGEEPLLAITLKDMEPIQDAPLTHYPVHVLEAMNEGLLHMDLKGTVLFINKKFIQFTGYSKKDMLGRPVWDAIRLLNVDKKTILANLKERAKGLSEVHEIKILDKKGRVKWLKVSASPVTDEHGVVTGAMGIYTDITEHKHTREENARLMSTINQTTDLVVMTDFHGVPFYINKACRKRMGVSVHEDMSELRVQRFYTEDSLRRHQEEVIPEVLRSGSWTGEMQFMPRKGKPFPVSQTIMAHFNEQGQVAYFGTIARDITEEKKAQREIAILARMPDENPSPTIRVDGQGSIVYANAASHILLDSWKTKVGKPLPKVWVRIVQKVLLSGHFRELETDVGRKVFDLKLVPIPEYDYVNIIASDITHKKRAEQQLMASEQKYRAIVEDQTEFITRFLADGTITFANMAYCRYFGFDPDRVQGQNIFDHLPKDKLIDFKERLASLTPETPVVTYDQFISGDNPRWQLWTDRAIFDEHGQFMEFQSVGQDITQLRRAETEVRRQQLYLRQIIDTLPNMVTVKDKAGKYILVNKAFSQFVGMPIKEVVGKTDKSLQVFKPFEKAHTKAEREVIERRVVKLADEEVITRADNGKTHWFHTVRAPLFSGGNQHLEVLGVSTEITELKRAEEALRQQLELKELISSISTNFINLSYFQIDEGINNALREIGEFVGVDRVVISLIGENREVVPTYFWFRDEGQGVTQASPSMKPVNYDAGMDELKKKGYLYVSDIQQMQGDTGEIKQRVQQLSVRSFLTLPLQLRNEMTGFLSLTNTREPKEWTEDSIALMKIISQVFSNTLERKNTEQLLNFTLEFENIITVISANFINIGPEKINDELRISMSYVARFFGIDQAYIFQTHSGRRKLKLTHSWKEEGADIDADLLNMVESGRYHWVYKQLRNYGVLEVPDTDSIPGKAGNFRKIMERSKVASLVGVPITYRGEFTGVLLLVSNDKKAFWPDEAVPLLKILGQVFANALDRKRTEENLSETREMYRTLAKNIPNSAVLLFDKDMRYRLVEGAALEEQGYYKEAIEGKTLNEVLSSARARELEPMYRSALEGREQIFEREYNKRHYLIHVLPVKNDQEEIYAGMVVSLDITDLKDIQRRLELQTKELMRSNEDLELFAYAASHDLQEPLRMVSSYVHLIQRKLGKVDQDVEEYMDFAVDGVKRMQELINDLLEYSRVDRRGKPFQSIDLNKIITLVQLNLKNRIEETGTQVVVPELPRIRGDQSQIISLFQNLLENGIKFKGEKPPVIEIGYEESKGEWVFSVKDNGIGIEKKFFERIFIIFQRLNSRKEYEGTGIGLAVCKKIVERHQGDIWVESELNEGTTFYFSISKVL